MTPNAALTVIAVVTLAWSVRAADAPFADQVRVDGGVVKGGFRFDLAGLGEHEKKMR